MSFIQTFPNKLVLIHGLLCLDFTNTVFWRLRDEPREGFRDYASLAKWSHKIGILTDAAANRLLREVETHPVEAAIFLSRAIRLREVLYRTITAAVNGSQPRADDLDSLNNEVTLMLQRILLIQIGDFF